MQSVHRMTHFRPLKLAREGWRARCIGFFWAGSRSAFHFIVNTTLIQSASREVTNNSRLTICPTWQYNIPEQAVGTLNGAVAHPAK